MVFNRGGNFAEVDLETSRFLIEVTNGTSSKAFQIREKYSNPIVNPEGKPIILLAPNFKDTKVKGALDPGATVVVKPVDELVMYLKKMKKTQWVSK